MGGRQRVLVKEYICPAPLGKHAVLDVMRRRYETDNRICFCKIGSDNCPFAMVSMNIKIINTNYMNDHLPVIAFLEPSSVA